MTRARATADTQDNNGGSVPPFVAAKNKILNSDFSIWQRGTSFTATNYVYTADRWLTFGYGAGTTTVSRQTFTPGSAPVSGYEGQFFLRVNSTQTQTWIAQRIEDVRTLAGQTVTISFWARASSGTPTIGMNWNQDFGSGGSTAVNTGATNQTINTSWARYSATISVPSISGKTIGTNSNIELAIFSTSINVNIDYWGVQVEAGSVATPFTTATGTLQGELAACQRYYWQGSGFQQVGGTQTAANETSVFMPLSLFNTVPMRATPTPSITGTSYITDFNSNLRTVTGLAMVQTSMVRVNYDSTKLTSLTSYGINVTSAGASFIFSSEL